MISPAANKSGFVKLGVNIDHVATVRQARRTFEPDPVWAAAIAQLGGADGITIHLREDRRHIQDRDVHVLKQTVSVKLNLECACIPEMLGIAVDVCPDQVCLVPEKREEITTEGGLDVAGNLSLIKDSVAQLHQAGIEVSLFIDADSSQIDASAECGANAVEIHTGQYAEAKGDSVIDEIKKIEKGVERVLANGMAVHAGHGLTYDNVVPIASILGIQELNIGHSIVSRALMVGMKEAVREMKSLLKRES